MFLIKKGPKKLTLIGDELNNVDEENDFTLNLRKDIKDTDLTKVESSNSDNEEYIEPSTISYLRNHDYLKPDDVSLAVKNLEKITLEKMQENTHLKPSPTGYKFIEQEPNGGHLNNTSKIKSSFKMSKT